MKKLLCMLLTASMITMLAACGGSTESTTDSAVTQAPEKTEEAAEATKAPEKAEDTAASGLAYKGELELMHFSTLEESEGNGGSDGFRTVIAQWESEHPDITLAQSVLANKDYKPQIATLAAANDLPDVFLLQGMNTKAWAEQGLVLDMTDIIADSPYAGQYDNSLFYPFTSEGKVYGIPALTGGTCAVVVYDSALWKEAGFDTFPETWAEVLEAKKYFDEQGIDTIAFGNSGKWQINSCFLSAVGDRFTGPGPTP